MNMRYKGKESILLVIATCQNFLQIFFCLFLHEFILGTAMFCVGVCNLKSCNLQFDILTMNKHARKST